MAVGKIPAAFIFVQENRNEWRIYIPIKRADWQIIIPYPSAGVFDPFIGAASHYPKRKTEHARREATVGEPSQSSPSQIPNTAQPGSPADERPDA